MSYEWLLDLPEYLTKWNCTWAPYEGWETRAAHGPVVRDYTPKGLINHHTAGTNWYPVDRLLKKCNLYINPAGNTSLVSAGYQFDSGYGDKDVLDRMVAGQEPEHPNLISDFLGNQFFIDIEVGHWGHGEEIPEVQRDELIRVNCAIMDMMGWDPLINLIGHLEWTRRKIDPNWSFNQERDTMANIRRDTAEYLALPSVGVDDMLIMQAMKAQTMAYYEKLQALTGSPGGNARYWGSDWPHSKPSQTEWDDAIEELFTAAVAVGVMHLEGAVPPHSHTGTVEVT